MVAYLDEQPKQDWIESVDGLHIPMLLGRGVDGLNTAKRG